MTPERDRMTVDEAVRYLRTRPEYADLVRDAYLGTDVQDAAMRFEASAEFGEVKRLLGDRIRGATMIDLGAGTGIASCAFAKHGARRVYALEPDRSDAVGFGAIHRVRANLPVYAVAACGEHIPFKDNTVDVLYARQVLHHTGDLTLALRECARVLKPGGVLLACREHVVDDEDQLQIFLAGHPVHQLAGGEGAHPLGAYVDAIRAAGLVHEWTLGPWDSVINAFPTVRSQSELAAYPRQLLQKRFGRWGALAYGIPGVRDLMWWRIKRPVPGRMYSFLASKADRH